MRVKVEITQEHINKGGHSCCNCAGALAINKWLTTLYQVDVGLDICYIYDKRDMLNPGMSWKYSFPPPMDLVNFINVYDFDKKAAIPTTFVLDLPEIYLDVVRVIRANSGT